MAGLFNTLFNIAGTDLFKIGSGNLFASTIYTGTSAGSFGKATLSSLAQHIKPIYVGSSSALRIVRLHLVVDYTYFRYIRVHLAVVLRKLQ